MAYTIRDKAGRSWVRLINVQGARPIVKRPFETAWRCDPCAAARARYQVHHPGGWREHAWWEVITNADTARERFEKWRMAGEVLAAAQTLATAEAAYRRLLGA